jgi:antitoxin (DNA-binding transcriptional repressor) of toxin-antitoxin stability system
MTSNFGLYQAETRLSARIERAAAGEGIVITKNGVAEARLSPRHRPGARLPAGARGLTHMAEDFDAQDPAIEAMVSGP